MPNATPLSTFRISQDDLKEDPALKEACDAYTTKLYEFGDAMRDLKAASKALHDLLEGPLREAGLIPEGKDWTFKEDDSGLYLDIQVWAEARRQGRRKPQVPVKQVLFHTSEASLMKTSFKPKQQSASQ